MNELQPLSGHQIVELLTGLGLSSVEDLEPFHPATRDRSDVSVYRCRRSEVIILSSVDHMSSDHYEKKEQFIFGQTSDRISAVKASLDDTDRRARQIRPLVVNKRWLDVGTGHGGILDQLAGLATSATAVEPQRKAREALAASGYHVIPDLKDISGVYDLITLYHVFEHLTEPIAFLRALEPLLAPQGKLIIEVPHARDLLLTSVRCEAFKRFTLWSEHLILHTRKSLMAFIQAAGFNFCEMAGCQRYPLANHLHWLANQKPGGHLVWAHLRDPGLDAAYEAKLSSIDRTDTLVAIVGK